MMPIEMIVLRLVHVLGGLFWVGSGLFSAFFLLPAMKDVGPTAGALMGALQRRRMFIVLPLVATLTVLSGLRLMWITSAGFSHAYFATGRGATFAAGGVAAIVAFLLGMFVQRPAGSRAAALGAALRDATDPAAKQELALQLERVQRRNGAVNRINGVLLILAAAAMAVARYIY